MFTRFLGALNLVGVVIGILVCLSARHVSDILVGLAIVCLTGSSGTVLLIARRPESLEHSLRQLLRRSALVSGIGLILVGLLILSFNPDPTGIAVSIVLISAALLDLWMIRRVHASDFNGE
jgi:cytochrome bd-type quinol oxidase subunit 2